MANANVVLFGKRPKLTVLIFDRGNTEDIRKSFLVICNVSGMQKKSHYQLSRSFHRKICCRQISINSMANKIHFIFFSGYINMWSKIFFFLVKILHLYKTHLDVGVQEMTIWGFHIFARDDKLHLIELFHDSYP